VKALLDLVDAEAAILADSSWKPGDVA